MKKAAKFTVYLALWVVALFGIGIAFTFINDAIQASGFFGDVKRVTPLSDGIDVWYDWGIRHYWYFWMCIVLFLISVLRIILWINWYWDRDIFE